jgi:chromosome segregation ATPase
MRRLEEFRGKTERQQDQINTLQTDRMETQRMLLVSEANVENLQQQFAGAQSEVTTLQCQLELEKVKAGKKGASLESELDQWKVKYKEVQQSSTDLDEVRDILRQRKDQVASLNIDLREMKKKLTGKEENDHKVQYLQSALSESELHLSLLKEQHNLEIKRIEENVIALKAEVDEWKQNHDVAVTSHIALRESLGHQ